MQLFYNLESADRFVYHYTSANTLIKYILPERKVKVSRFDELNDPREYKCWEFGFGTNANFAGNFDDLTEGRRASALMKSNCRVFCGTLDYQLSVGMGIDKIHGRGFCRSRMWAQYGKNHTGACLVLDKAALHASLEATIANRCSLYFGPVRYRNRSQAPSLRRPNAFVIDYDEIRRVGLALTVATHIEYFYEELFLEKAVDWSDEKEYRWVANLPDASELYVPIHDAVAAILLGDNIAPADRSSIIAIVQGLGIAVGQLNWKCGVPEVIPVV